MLHATISAGSIGHGAPSHKSVGNRNQIAFFARTCVCCVRDQAHRQSLVVLPVALVAQTSTTPNAWLTHQPRAVGILRGYNCLPVKIRALARPIPHRRRPRADPCRCIAIASITAASPQPPVMKVRLDTNSVLVTLIRATVSFHQHKRGSITIPRCRAPRWETQESYMQCLERYQV